MKGTEPMESTELQTWEEPETEVVKAVVDSSAAALAKSEVEAQLDAAHKYRRSISRFRQEALSMATISQEVAESCLYTLKRGGKPIAGPSVRLAEICASAYGNLHIAARVVAIEEKEIVAQGGAWDLEKNLRVSVESRRRITGSNGARYSDDMITVTGNAAASIALRNAIFRVIPKAYVDSIYEQVRQVAIGKASTLAGRRAQILERLAKYGADQPRVLHALGKNGVEDINLEDLEILIGYGTAIKNGDKTVDEVFPAPLAPVPAAEEGKRMSLGSRGKGAAKPAEQPKPAKTLNAEGEPVETPHDPVTGEVKEPGADG